MVQMAMHRCHATARSQLLMGNATVVSPANSGHMVCCLTLFGRPGGQLCVDICNGVRLLVPPEQCVMWRVAG
jgi:hypothetical protein